MATMESRNGWKWYGFAGHLIVSRRCAFHLCTLVDPYLISTVGAYFPPHGDKMETIGSGPDDYYETLVFSCTEEDENGNPAISDILDVLDARRYADSREAERGHYEFCHKWANLIK